MSSGDTDSQLSNSATEAQIIHRFSSLHIQDSGVPVAAGSMASLVYSQCLLRFGAWNWSWRLSSRIRCADGWPLCWCDHSLGVNQNRHGPKHDLGPQVWIRKISFPGLVNVTGNRYHCDQSKSNRLKTKETAMLAKVCICQIYSVVGTNLDEVVPHDIVCFKKKQRKIWWVNDWTNIGCNLCSFLLQNRK